MLRLRLQCVGQVEFVVGFEVVVQVGMWCFEVQWLRV